MVLNEPIVLSSTPIRLEYLEGAIGKIYNVFLCVLCGLCGE